VIESAQKSPVYKFVKTWKLALPPHVEYRTFPMLFYVPPLAPSDPGSGESRIPLRYLAGLFGAGDEAPVRYALLKERAVRAFRRAAKVGDGEPTAGDLLREAGCSPEEADAIYRLTTVATAADRFVVPPPLREQAVDLLQRGDVS
jgi:nitrate reductase beta subunit